jgi:predicted Fe-Mo cluster-binding NifX family protein
MVETPAAVQIIEELCEEGLDFISFGTNDLTQFTLALDRNEEHVQSLYDETHPAVLREIAHVIEVCRDYGVETSICGQAGSRPEMAKFLVECGIDSVSVNADAARKISLVIAEVEKNLHKSKEAKTVQESEQNIESEEQDPDEIVIKPARINVPQEKDSVDIEEEILKELDNGESNGNGDYVPGMANGGDEDIPPLNEAMPVGSDTLQELAEAESVVEDELVKESQKEIINGGKENKEKKK